MYRDTTNVEPEMYDYTSNNWSHWNSNEKLKEGGGRNNNNNNYYFLLICILHLFYLTKLKMLCALFVTYEYSHKVLYHCHVLFVT